MIRDVVVRIRFDDHGQGCLPTDDQVAAALAHSTASEALADATGGCSVTFWVPTPDDLVEMLANAPLRSIPLAEESMKAHEYLQALFDAARRHGEAGEVEDGATHEVGDLQSLLVAAWRIMGERQRLALLQSKEAQAIGDCDPGI